MGNRPGLSGRLGRLLGGGLEWAELRLALFANGLQFEKLRLLESLAWLAAALVAAGVGLLLLLAFVLLLAGEAWRLPLLGLMALLLLAGAGWAWRTALERLQGDEPPFAALREELVRDRDTFGAKPGRGEGEAP